MFALNEEMVNKRRKHVHEQNGQHHSFGISGVDDADENHHHPDEEAVYELPLFGKGGRDRVGCHKDHSECPTTDDKVPVERHREHGVCFRADGIQ